MINLMRLSDDATVNVIANELLCVSFVCVLFFLIDELIANCLMLMAIFMELYALNCVCVEYIIHNYFHANDTAKCMIDKFLLLSSMIVVYVDCFIVQRLYHLCVRSTVKSLSYSLTKFIVKICLLVMFCQKLIAVIWLLLKRYYELTDKQIRVVYVCLLRLLRSFNVTFAMLLSNFLCFNELSNQSNRDVMRNCLRFIKHYQQLLIVVYCLMTVNMSLRVLSEQQSVLVNVAYAMTSVNELICFIYVYDMKKLFESIRPLMNLYVYCLENVVMLLTRNKWVDHFNLFDLMNLIVYYNIRDIDKILFFMVVYSIAFKLLHMLNVVKINMKNYIAIEQKIDIVLMLNYTVYCLPMHSLSRRIFHDSTLQSFDVLNSMLMSRPQNEFVGQRLMLWLLSKRNVVFMLMCRFVGDYVARISRISVQSISFVYKALLLYCMIVSLYEFTYVQYMTKTHYYCHKFVHLLLCNLSLNMHLMSPVLLLFCYVFFDLVSVYFACCVARENATPVNVNVGGGRSDVRHASLLTSNAAGI